MRHAPTRRPQNYPDKRRTPKGRRPVARPIRDDLKTGAELLTEYGHLLEQKEQHEKAGLAFDAASACRVVDTPGGWAVLRDSDPAPGGMTSLSVMMSVDLRSSLQDAAQRFGKSLDALAAEALVKAAEGKFVPPKPYVGPGEKRNLSLSVPTVLKDKVAKLLPGLTSKAGHRVSLASTITWYLVDELGVDLAATDALRLIVPKPFADHVKARAAAEGVTLEQVLAGQIAALVDGSYTPRLPERSRQGGVFATTTGTGQSWGKDLPVVKLTLRIDQRLLDELRERTEDITRAAGWQAAPGMVAIAMLRDRLGEPE